MNEADSGRVAAELDALGYSPTDNAQDADVIVLNTCVVRQSAEDRAAGHLWSLKPLKELDPSRVIALMGCMVGIKPNAALRQRFPFVDVFMPPSEPGPLVGHLTGHEVEVEAKGLDDEETEARHLFLDYGSPEAAAMGLVNDCGLPTIVPGAERSGIADFGLDQPAVVERPESVVRNPQSSKASAISRSAVSRPSPPTCPSSTAARTRARSASSRSGGAWSAAGR